MMAQSEKMYLSTVYCWRENNKAIVKASFYCFKGNDEKFLYSIDTDVECIGPDLTRGFKFVGDGSFAILPETHLRVNVADFFAGKLSGRAMTRPELALKMNVVNALSGDRAVRLCSVLTFNAAEEEVSFGGLTFTRRPSENKNAINSREKKKERNDKDKKVEKRRREVRETVKEEAPANPDMESLLRARMKDEPSPIEELEKSSDISSQLEGLLESTKILKVETDVSEEESDKNSTEESDSDQEENRLLTLVRMMKRTACVTVSAKMLNKLTETRYPGKITSLEKRKKFIGHSDYSLYIDKKGELFVFEGISLNAPTTVYSMSGEDNATFVMLEVDK